MGAHITLQKRKKKREGWYEWAFVWSMNVWCCMYLSMMSINSWVPTHPWNPENPFSTVFPQTLSSALFTGPKITPHPTSIYLYISKPLNLFFTQMAQEDSSPDPSPSPPNLSDPSKPDPPPPSSSSSSLSRNVSFSRLNAQAPEFVPTQQQAPRLAAAAASASSVVPPPPPPPPPMHSFPPPPPPPPFHVAAAIQGHVAVPPHVIPVQHPHHVPVQYHPHHPHHPHPHPHHHHQQYYGGGGGGGGGGFREQEVGAQVQNQAPVESDHVVAAASSSSAKNKISEEATQKILNQVWSLLLTIQTLAHFLYIYFQFRS